MNGSAFQKLKNVWVISGLFLSALVGAGFATGREIFVYFARFGWWGMMGFVLACLLLCITAVYVLQGRPVAPFFDYVIRLFTFCGYITMVAGFRDVLTLLFPDVALYYPFSFGVAACGIISAFTLLVLYRGFGFFAGLCQVITPILILCILAISVYTLGKQGFSDISVDSQSDGVAFLLPAVLYTGYNILFLAGVLKRADSVRGTTVARTGGILGALLFLAGGIGIFVVLIQNQDAIAMSAMPLCTLALSWKGIFRYGFQGIVAMAMLLCGASALGSAAGDGSNRLWNGKMMILSAVPLSYIGFNKCLSLVYPVFGVMGIFLLLTLAQTHRKNV